MSVKAWMITAVTLGSARDRGEVTGLAGMTRAPGLVRGRWFQFPRLQKRVWLWSSVLALEFSSKCCPEESFELKEKSLMTTSGFISSRAAKYLLICLPSDACWLNPPPWPTESDVPRSIWVKTPAFLHGHWFVRSFIHSFIHSVHIYAPSSMLGAVYTVIKKTAIVSVSWHFESHRQGRPTINKETNKRIYNHKIMSGTMHNISELHLRRFLRRCI